MYYRQSSSNVLRFDMPNACFRVAEPLGFEADEDRTLKISRRRVSFLQREEADRLIKVLPEHMKPIVRFALATGFCVGEILGVG
jgi:integrase